MDFFDGAVAKAKAALDVACKKTNEAVTVQRQHFDISSLEAKRAKDFEALGRLYYEEIGNLTPENEKIAELKAAIDEKNEKIDALRRELNEIKNKRICPHCGTAVDKFAVFCSACGEKLVYEENASEEKAEANPEAENKE